MICLFYCFGKHELLNGGKYRKKKKRNKMKWNKNLGVMSQDHGQNSFLFSHLISYILELNCLLSLFITFFLFFIF